MKHSGLPWELLGAAVGAGLASGREIASFFGRYSGWGYAGICVSAGVIAWLTAAQMPEAWRGRWPERLWRVLQALLVTATGGAMLAAAGDTAALVLPVKGAYPLGWAMTLLAAWLLARHTRSGLTWVSRALLAAMALLLTLGLLLPPMRAKPLGDEDVLSAVVRGASYGGFNAALMRPQLLRLPGERRRGQLLAACGMIAMLLCLGMLALQRHPALLGEPLPFVRMMAGYGRAGHMLSAVGLYLAILSTLTACIRVQGAWGTAGAAAMSLVGFTGVVDLAYLLLGAGCTGMLAAMRLSERANLRNYSGKTFHSGRDMI